MVATIKYYGRDHDCNLHNFFVPCLNYLIFVLFSPFLTLVFVCAVATKPISIYSNEGLFHSSLDLCFVFLGLFHSSIISFLKLK